MQIEVFTTTAVVGWYASDRMALIYISADEVSGVTCAWSRELALRGKLNRHGAGAVRQVAHERSLIQAEARMLELIERYNARPFTEISVY